MNIIDKFFNWLQEKKEIEIKEKYSNKLYITEPYPKCFIEGYEAEHLSQYTKKNYKFNLYDCVYWNCIDHICVKPYNGRLDCPSNGEKPIE